MFADLIILAVLALCAVLAIRKIISDRKKGIGSCGHVCASCHSGCSCNALQMAKDIQKAKKGLVGQA